MHGDVHGTMLSAGSLGNTPHSGLASLSFFGLNFGSVDHTATLAINGRLCASTSWTSGTGLVCGAPPSFAAALAPQLTVGASVGTSAGGAHMRACGCAFTHARTHGLSLTGHWSVYIYRAGLL